MPIKYSSNFYNRFYTHEYFLLLLFLLRLFPITADFSYVILGVYACYGNRNIIHALFILWLFSMINYEIIPTANYFYISKYFVIFFCFFSILLRTSLKKLDHFNLFTIILVIFFLFHSIFISQIPMISFLKVLNWMIVIITLSFSFKNLSFEEFELTKKLLIDTLFKIVLLSFPFLLFSDIGYSRNDFAFHGVFNHPQAFGLTMAITASLLLEKLFFNEMSKIEFFVKFLLSSSLIYLSMSRTAGLALIFGLFVFLFLILLNINYKKIVMRAITFKIAILSFLLLAIMILQFSSTITDFFNIYLSKQGRIVVENLYNAYEISRGLLYQPMIDNIIKNPILGIGFGIASDLSAMKIDYFLGVPVSAAIEKGILPLAVIEEVGIFGFIIFILWIYLIIKTVLIKNFYSSIVLFTLLFLNFGEAGLFSPGGFGMLYLLILILTIYNPKKPKNN